MEGLRKNEKRWRLCEEGRSSAGFWNKAGEGRRSAQVWGAHPGPREWNVPMGSEAALEGSYFRESGMKLGDQRQRLEI